MADSKVSALTATTSLADTDLLYVSSSGADKKITGANLKASVSLDNLSDAAITSASSGQSLRHDGSNFVNAPELDRYLMPTGALFETFSRAKTTTTNSGVLSTQRISWVALPLPKGLAITGIAFWSGTTALSSATNQYAALCDSSYNRLAVSSNGTSGAWAANSEKRFALTGTFVTTYEGLHVLALLIDATTVPTLTTRTISGSGALETATPRVNGHANTGVTSIPATLGSISTVGYQPYAYVY